MSTMRLTAKRQATLPKELCEELAIHPGDSLQVDRKVIDGEETWCLKPIRTKNTDWFGSLQKYAVGKKHDMESIRRSIESERKHES